VTYDIARYYGKETMVGRGLQSRPLNFAACGADLGGEPVTIRFFI
jgi:hypothetical protein